MKNSKLFINQTCEFSRQNVNYNLQGVLGSVPAGTTGNVDLLMADDNFLCGGQLAVKGGVFGDTCNMQVVDRDMMLQNVPVTKDDGSIQMYVAAGVPLTYGMIPGYPMLNQFVTNCQIMDQAQKQEQFLLPYVAKIIAGLYLRMVYTSTGTEPVLVSANFELHKALY